MIKPLEKAYTTFDTSNFPLVIIAFTGNEATEANFSDYLTKTHQLYDAKEDLAIIFDATHATLPGFKYQKMQADWLKENEALMKNYCQGTAYIIPNLLVRGILKAIFAIQKQPVPYQVFSDYAQAEHWARQQLKK